MDLFIGACISPPELQQLRAEHRRKQGPSAFSPEPPVLIYKAEQSSEALASVTEVFALASYDSFGQL